MIKGAFDVVCDAMVGHIKCNSLQIRDFFFLNFCVNQPCPSLCQRYPHCVLTLAPFFPIDIETPENFEPEERSLNIDTFTQFECKPPTGSPMPQVIIILLFHESV